MFMPDLLEDGLNLFNKGQFYDAHETWEDLWRLTVEPATKVCYQGLIQAAVGLHHLERGNRIGAESQLRKSIRNLQNGDNSATNLDIDGLIFQLKKILEVMPAKPPRSLRIARLQ
jgi:hypothetical protein